MDELTYAYSGNRVQSVIDEANQAIGFRDEATTGSEYGYDANGNMTRDDNKGITRISYDPVLDVPLRVDFANGSRITYTYDGAGNRLAETVTQPDGSSTTTDYLGGMQYRDGTLELIQHPEGRVKRKGDG